MIDSTLTDLFKDIADAIRNKLNVSEKISPANFPAKISEIGSSKKVLLPTTLYDGFISFPEIPSIYFKNIQPAPFALSIGNTYTVIWDGVSWCMPLFLHLTAVVLKYGAIIRK